VLVPDLQWLGAPAVLDGWAKASLSLRSARPQAGAADGYLTVGKGGRSSTPSPRAGVGPVVAAGDGAVRLAAWDQLRAHDASLHYSGDLGTLGQALITSGRSWALVAEDPAAATAAADRHGIVPRALRGGAPTVGQVLAAGANALVVAVPAAEVPAVVDSAESACVLVASVSSPDNDRHLGVLAASPLCGLGRAGLSSPSTHQAHLATLLDVPATFLSRLGIARPATMGGSAVESSSAVSTEALVDRDRRAVTADRVRTTLVWLFVSLTALGAAVALRWPRARPLVSWTLLAIPTSSFLVMTVPWWRWGLIGALLAGGAMVAGLAVLGAILSRRHAELGVGVLAGLAAAVVGIDAAFGGRLEIDAPFGNSPVVAGRFYGMGNIGSGFLVASLIVVVALVLDAGGRRAAGACAGVLGAGVLVGGGPWFGADVGGILMSVPAYSTLIVVACRRRLSFRLVAALIATTVVVLGLFLAADLIRPAPDRTHLGRVLIGGDLLGEIVRKGGQALATVTEPLSLVVVFGVGAVVAGRVQFGNRRVVAMAWALAVAAVVGSVVNDSGLIVGAAVTAVGWPALLILGDPPPEPATARR